MTEQQYSDYFELLATKNKRIGHTPQTPRFFYTRDDQLTELENAIRNKLKLPVLTADQFYDNPSMKNDNFRTRIVGGFSVLVKVEKGNIDGIRQARQEAREIALSILFRIRKDFMVGGVMGHHRAILELDFEGSPTPVVGEIATGWAYPIELTVPQIVAVRPDDWDD